MTIILSWPERGGGRFCGRLGAGIRGARKQGDTLRGRAVGRAHDHWRSVEAMCLGKGLVGIEPARVTRLWIGEGEARIGHVEGDLGARRAQHPFGIAAAVGPEDRNGPLLDPRADRLQFGFELLAVAAVESRRRRRPWGPLAGAPGDRAVRGQASERYLLRGVARGAGWFSSLALLRRAAPAASRVRIEGEQTGCRQILTGFHVVDPADHQIFRRAVDVEQRRFGGDFAQAAKAIAGDRVDRRLGRRSLSAARTFAVSGACSRGSEAGHAPSGCGRQGDDGGQSPLGAQPARRLAPAWRLFSAGVIGSSSRRRRRGRRSRHRCRSASRRRVGIVRRARSDIC
jgi:hypothetical protein